MKKRLITVGLITIMILSLLLMSGCDELLQQFIDLQDQLEDLEDLPAADEQTTEEPSNQDGIIPFDILMGFSQYANIQLSNDGETIMYRYNNDFVIENWKTGDKQLVEWPREAGGIPRFFFAPDGETVLFFVDDMGDENYGIYISDISSGDTKTIFPAGENDCGFVSDNPANEKEIYITKFDFDRNLFDLYLLNYITGGYDLVLENPGDIVDYVFDNEGVLRCVGTIDDIAGIHYWLKKDSSGDQFNASDWEEIEELTWTYEDAGTSSVYGFMPDDERILFLDTANSNTSTLSTYNVLTKQRDDVYNNPDYDINGTWTDLELEEVVAVDYYGETIEWAILDESFQDDYDVLADVGDGIFDIIGSSEQDEYWLVEYVSDVQGSDYYVYDMQNHEATFLYNSRPELQNYDFAPKEPIKYTATDGLKIEGYATFPIGVERKDLPTVLLVHGGPWARDTWEFDPEVQFLANRGYLVIQVNFRGSTGYGKDFVLAGDKEWGGKMHQDILDAVDYAVSMGWTDSDKVGVYGASYGGYEALICAAFSSDVFKCSVDAFGPSSLLTFIESIPPQWSTSYQDLIRSVGDPDTEADFMRERSPLYYADDIEIPMLIAQGENDVRVVKSESDQMVAALEAAGVPVEYLVLKDTGHGFSSDETREMFYKSMESFFAEYLGGRVEE